MKKELNAEGGKAREGRKENRIHVHRIVKRMNVLTSGCGYNRNKTHGDSNSSSRHPAIYYYYFPVTANPHDCHSVITVLLLLELSFTTVVLAPRAADLFRHRAPSLLQLKQPSSIAMLSPSEGEKKNHKNKN